MAARDPAMAAQAREAVCAAYWQPVCSYLQSLGLDATQSEDLTQNILAHFCNDGWIETVDRAQGSLRHFFKAAARNALSNHFRNAQRQKRGGSQTTLSVDELTETHAPSSNPADDAMFDKHWAWGIFDRAMAELAAGYERRHKAALFEAIKPALISPDEMQGHAEIGSSLGMSGQQISIEIHRLRRRMADALRLETAATLGPGATAAEIDAEVRHLVKALTYERGH